VSGFAAASNPYPNLREYSGSNGIVKQMCENLRREVGPKRIIIKN
jgi:NADP-dependent 3-hydroxy acid dehydrogenase YdfG